LSVSAAAGFRAARGQGGGRQGAPWAAPTCKLPDQAGGDGVVQESLVYALADEGC